MARTLGPYELLRPLAQGGMAEVFLARRVSGSVEKRLVIKRIRRERASDPRFVAMFVEEARLSMALVHRNIVPVFDFGRAGDELFLAMELVDGPDFDAMLRHAREHGTRLDPMLVAYIALEACQALEHAHHARAADGTPRPLVHRDVTPRNVLVSRAGEVKLVDFGVATSEVAGGRDTGKVRGTPAYMAPEQARGQVVDGRADLFSLGLVMWEALAGRRAYEGRRQDELMAQARAGQVPPLPGDAPDEAPGAIPERLRRIVARATAAQPADRYASAREMQLALDEYLVAARAAASSAPPSHLLAAWIQERFPPEQRVTGDIAVPDGPVVTFLDDGAGSVLGDQERATLRSMAETVAEPPPATRSPAALASTDLASAPGVGADASPEDDRTPGGAAGRDAHRGPDAVADAPVAAPARGARAWTFAAGAATVAAVAVAVALGRSGPPAAPTPPSTAVPALPSTAVPAPMPVHASGIPPSGPPAAPAPDAGPVVAVARPAPGDAPEPHPGQHPGQSPGHSSGSDARPGHPPGARPDRPAARQPRPPGNGAPAHGSAAPAPAPGTVKISVTPWARVTVVGSSASCAETPCVLELPAGKHTLRLINPVAGLTKDRVIELAPGETLVVRETLSP
ncbi:MAG TPA: protein kinase [Haliangium sp.]|nr:protein kinase [Haliangium sp.]